MKDNEDADHIVFLNFCHFTRILIKPCMIYSVFRMCGIPCVVEKFCWERYILRTQHIKCWLQYKQNHIAWLCNNSPLQGLLVPVVQLNCVEMFCQILIMFIYSARFIFGCIFFFFFILFIHLLSSFVYEGFVM